MLILCKCPCASKDRVQVEIWLSMYLTPNFLRRTEKKCDLPSLVQLWRALSHEASIIPVPSGTECAARNPCK